MDRSVPLDGGTVPLPKELRCSELERQRTLQRHLAVAETRQRELRIADVAIAAAILSAVRVAGLEHDSRLRMEIDAGLRAQADVVRARQVVINLLTNAKRHTPDGGEINIRASRSAD